MMTQKADKTEVSLFFSFFIFLFFLFFLPPLACSPHCGCRYKQKPEVGERLPRYRAEVLQRFRVGAPVYNVLTHHTRTTAWLRGKGKK
jgi:hypothetical protein